MPGVLNVYQKVDPTLSAPEWNVPSALPLPLVMVMVEAVVPVIVHWMVVPAVMVRVVPLEVGPQPVSTTVDAAAMQMKRWGPNENNKKKFKKTETNK